MRTRTQLLFLWILAMVPLAILLPDDTYPPAILLPTIIGVALDSLLLLSYAAMRNQSQHGRVALLQAFSGVALLGLTLLLPLEDGQIAIFALARTLLSLLLVLIVVGYLGREYLRFRFPLVPTRKILLLSRPFLWAELASSVYIRADLTIISLVLGAVGTSIYGPAITILQASFLALRALFFLIVPVLSRTYAKNRDEFLSLSLAQLVVQVLAGTVISIVLFVFAEQIINLIFTTQYEESARVLRLLSPIPFFRSINFALGAILTSSKRQYRRTRVQISAAVFNVVGNLIVIVPFGIVGVSIVYIFSELLLSVGYALLMRNLRGQLR
jgi:O-antigen/teichoic acid export membrane protein